jgi:hypothetical protein
MFIKGFPTSTMRSLVANESRLWWRGYGSTLKHFNEDLNNIMEKNHDYLFKREVSNKQKKVISIKDTLNTLEMKKDSNHKILLADSTEIIKVRHSISLVADV